MHLEVGNPTTEPVTTSEAKTHLRIDSSDEDTLIDTYITTARQLIERELGQTLATATHILYLDEFPSSNKEIILPRPPLQSITSIQYYDSDDVLQTWSSAEYQLSVSYPSRIKPEYGYYYPATRSDKMDSVIITYVAGYMTVPEWAKLLIKAFVGYWYENREAFQPNVKLEELEGIRYLLDNNRVYEAV